MFFISGPVSAKASVKTNYQLKVLVRIIFCQNALEIKKEVQHNVGCYSGMTHILRELKTHTHIIPHTGIAVPQ